MKTWIALLRGINVGGAGKLPMKEFRTILADLGAVDIETYIQSGNAIFSHAEAKRERLAKKIASAIERSHGFLPAVLLMTPAELGKIVANNPFAGADTKSLHYWLLPNKPKKADSVAIDKLKTASESWSIKGACFYLCAPDGIGRSKLAQSVERLLGVPVTARNQNTVAKLLEMAGE